MASAMDKGAGQIVETPHAHDVLCGRGGRTNLHAGNEWFRRLVRSNRPLYRSCPKHTKLLVAKAIVQAVQQQNPPGRFLESANKEAGTWVQITYKRCVDKTSQALREKEPPPDDMVPAGAAQPPENATNKAEISQEAAELAAQAKRLGTKHADLSGLAKAALRQAGLDKERRDSEAEQQRQREMQRKRKGMQDDKPFIKPPWWGQRIPTTFSVYDNNTNIQQEGDVVGQGSSAHPSPANKRMKTETDESLPLPPTQLQARQSSLFRFLSGSGMFGRNDAEPSPNANQNGFFSFSGGARTSFVGQQPVPNPSDLISMEAATFERNHTMGSPLHPEPVTLNPQQSFGNTIMNLEPLPLNGNVVGHHQQQEVDHINNGQGFPQAQQNTMMYGNLRNGPSYHRGDILEEIPTAGLMGSAAGDDSVAPPPTTRLASQVSDWLSSFWPTGKDQIPHPQQQETPPPPPPPPPLAENLERSISSTIFNLARSPSQFLTSLRSGVTSMVFGTDEFAPIPLNQSRFDSSPPQQQGGSSTTGLMGNASASRPDSLLDDYEESPLETRLRSVRS